MGGRLAGPRRRLSGDASEGISAEHLLAEVVGAFEFASARGEQPVAVRAFNPVLAEHGYEPLGSGGQPFSAELTLPPLAGIWLVPEDQA